jgi:hypothetical protein
MERKEDKLPVPLQCCLCNQQSVILNLRKNSLHLDVAAPQNSNPSTKGMALVLRVANFGRVMQNLKFIVSDERGVKVITPGL